MSLRSTWCLLLLVLVGCGSLTPASRETSIHPAADAAESTASVLADSIRAAYLWQRLRHLNPPVHFAYRTAAPPSIDGDLDEAAWSDAPALSPFTEITGQPTMPDSISTTVRIMWDDDALYIGARLREPHVWGTQTEKNSIIFHENDFEVFIDPDADFHRYHELEINALGTIWELTLMSPYRDGGPYTIPDNFPGLKKAVSVKGTINDPSDIDEGWSVEIAVPWEDLSNLHDLDPIPDDGAVLRMNFSRVRWDLVAQDSGYTKTTPPSEINWTWSPTGIVDIHRPEKWGAVIFINSEPPPPREAPSQQAQAFQSSVQNDLELQKHLMDAYYFAAHYRARKNRFPLSLQEIHPDIRSADPELCYAYSGSEEEYLMQIARRPYDQTCPKSPESWKKPEIRGFSIDHRGKLRRIDN